MSSKTICWKQHEINLFTSLTKQHQVLNFVVMSTRFITATTLPLMVGVFCIFGVELSIVIQYFQHGLFTGWQTFGLFMGLEIMMLFIHRALPVKNELYYSFALEGTPIYLAAIVYIFSLF